MDGAKEDRGLVWQKRCSQILFEHLLKLDSIVAWLTATTPLICSLEPKYKLKRLVPVIRGLCKRLVFRKQKQHQKISTIDCVRTFATARRHFLSCQKRYGRMQRK